MGLGRFSSIMILLVLAHSIFVFAMEPIVVRTISANPSTRTYTFACLENPPGSGLAGNGIRNWEVYSENPENTEIKLDLPANQNFTYTFNYTDQRAYYNVKCIVPNPPGLNYTSNYRHDIHLDFRTQLGNPAVIPLSVAPGQITETCAYNGTNYTIRWDLTTYGFTGGGRTTRYSLNNTNSTITFTPPFTPGLFDTHCIVHLNNLGIDIDVAWAIEFPTVNSTPYIADHTGIDLNNNYIPFDYNTWISFHNGTSQINNTLNSTQNGSILVRTSPTLSNVFLNGIFQGVTSNDTGVLFIFNVIPNLYNLLVSAFGYNNYTTSFSLSPGQNLSFNINLTPLTVNTTNVTTNNTTNNTIINITTSTSCFSNVQNITTNCTVGIITQDTFNGCRTLVCTNNGDSMQILACDKPNNVNPQYFEMYKQSQVGTSVSVICIGTTCMKDNGYAKSVSYPICVNTTTQNGNLLITTVPAFASVFLNSLAFGTTDNSGQLLITNIVPRNYNLLIQKINYSDYITNISINSGQNVSLNITLTSNVSLVNALPLPPQWVEPSINKSDVDTFDFHIQVFGMQDAENDKHTATDFEMYDALTNERVWSSLFNTVILTHIHNADGNFEGNLANNSRNLLFNHDYKLRVRFYENTTDGIIQSSAWSDWRPFHTTSQINFTIGTSLWTARSGYSVELVASNISIPVNIAMAPDIYGNFPFEQRPLLYVTQLYGQIGMIRKDGKYVQYATNLLNYNSTGSFPGSGETGVDGLYVDPATGDLFVSMVYQNLTALNGFLGKVVRFKTNASGDGYLTLNLILSGIPVAPSHHIHEITRGPDGKLYVSVGDAHDLSSPKDISKLSGKILRFNEDGSIPADNPYPNSYVYASGFRNAFGTAWRPGTNELYATNNGPDSDDGVYKVHAGDIFGWCCNTSISTWHLWHKIVAPVQDVFDTGISRFPSDSNGTLYAALSGSTYKAGPSNLSKRIVQFRINPDGTEQSVDDFVVYSGAGFGTPIGLAFGSDGLYFTDIYGEAGFVGAGVTRGNIYRVIVGNQSNITINQTNATFSATLSVARWYPQGLNVVWNCKALGGSGNFAYNFYFDDGNVQTNMQQDNTYHTYPANGTYNANCTINDLITNLTAFATTKIILGTRAPTPSVQNGSIMVNTIPNFADVLLNNILQGTTNNLGQFLIQNVVPGNYNLLVRKATFNDNLTPIPLAAGQNLSISVVLNQNQTTINTTNCFSTVQNITTSCTTGSFTTDTFNGCRTLVCTNNGDSMQILACDKPNNANPQYFEMYKQSQVGTSVSVICIGATCIKDNGYARSVSYPICT